MLLTKRSRSLRKQPQQALERPGEKGVWGKKQGKGAMAAPTSQKTERRGGEQRRAPTREGHRDGERDPARDGNAF